MERVTRRIKREILLFTKLSRNVKLLLLCSALFWFSNPFINLFLNIYLWKESNSLHQVALFNFFYFLIIPFGFILNGLLLKRFSANRAFQLGLLIQAVFPLIIIAFKDQAFNFLSFLGLVSGLGASFYWANLNLLIYDFTSDKIRGYFLGVIEVLGSFVGIIAPPVAGFVIGVLGQKWLGISIRSSYYLSFFVACLIFLLASLFASKITLKKEKLDFSFKALSLKRKSKKWSYVRLLNLATGFYWGVLSFSLALLTYNFLGKELYVGYFNGFLAILGAFTAYFAGRLATPERRVLTTAIGALLFFIGSIFLGINFSLFGFLIFAFLINIGNLFIWMVHFPIEMREMDKGHLVKKSRYYYFIDIEIFLNSGRLLGIASFLLLANYLPFAIVFRLIFTIISVLPFIILWSVKRLAKISS